MQEKVIEIVRKQGCIDEDVEITTATGLKTELWLDSLDIVEILTTLEDEFDIEIYRDAEEFFTVEDLIAVVEELL